MKFLKNLTQKFKDIQAAAEQAQNIARAKAADTIMLAAEQGDVKTLRDIFDERPNVSQSSAAAYALAAACEAGQKSTTAYLLNIGVPPCSTRAGRKEPAAYAAKGGHSDIIALLYKHVTQTGEAPSPFLQQEWDKVNHQRQAAEAQQKQDALQVEIRDAGTLKKNLKPMKPLSVRKTPTNT